MTAVQLQVMVVNFEPKEKPLVNATCKSKEMILSHKNIMSEAT